jgi:hypothetical protein
LNSSARSSSDRIAPLEASAGTDSPSPSSIRYAATLFRPTCASLA